MGTLTVHYEGYWQCRQATDPDPSDDRRGASGYTFAFGRENDLDMVVRLQGDDILKADFRAGPEPYYPPTQPFRTFGVFVTDITYDKAPYPPGAKMLKGAKIRWMPANCHERDTATGLVPGPKFELRNTITTFPVTNGIFMPIAPFHIRVEGDGVAFGRFDPLDPNYPDRQIWEMSDYRDYARRCPVEYTNVSDEALAAIGISTQPPNDWNAYFQKRKEWLQLQLTNPKLDAVEREAFRNRLFQLDNNDRFENRLGLQATWDFALTGKTDPLENTERLGGTIDPKAPWQVRFWMGAFDGDLMRGYMRGTLCVPFDTRL